jgi:membrane fusion protein, multidrug efflux system
MRFLQVSRTLSNMILSNKTLSIPAVLIFFLTIFLGGQGSAVFAQDNPQGEAQPPAQPPARVVISKIVHEQLAQNHSFIGTLYYERVSHVSSEVPGLVTQIKVRAGDRVNKDDILVHLDTQILEKEIQFHKNQIELARLDIDHKQVNFQRMETLYKKSSLSQKDFDDARYVHKAAILRQFSAQTSLEKLLIQKRKSIITVPFDGIILAKNVDLGDWVQQGKQLFDIGSVNDLFIRVPMAETLLKFVEVGQSVIVIINAYDREMTGIIENLSPIADAKTKNIFLKVRIPMLNKVAQNMSATVFIATGNKETLSMIPRDALIRFQGNDFVYAVKENKAVRLPVHIVTFQGNRMGADDAHFIEGMPIVVEGNERLRPGQPVVILYEKSDEKSDKKLGEQ